VVLFRPRQRPTVTVEGGFGDGFGLCRCWTFLWGLDVGMVWGGWYKGMGLLGWFGLNGFIRMGWVEWGDGLDMVDFGLCHFGGVSLLKGVSL